MFGETVLALYSSRFLGTLSVIYRQCPEHIIAFILHSHNNIRAYI